MGITQQLDSLFSTVTDVFITVFLFFTLLSLFSTYILKVVAKWQIFKKADENGWAALIPFYNRYVFYTMVWGNGNYFLASYIPGISYVMHIISMVKLSTCFEKNGVFAFGLIFWEPLFLAILGFDESEYIGYSY